MARGRMLDKVIILSKKINAISEGAENLYYRIYVNTDDFGLFHANPKILKGQIYTLRNISITTIEKRLNELIKIGLIKIYKNDGERYIKIIGFEKHQTFRKDYTLKQEYPSPSTDSYETVQACTKSLSKLNKGKLIEVKEKVIDHFNETTGQKRSYTCDGTNKLINGRLSEGRTLNDFKHVIDTKYTQWRNDEKMSRFIRPSTLFRPENFENYLNEPYEDPKKKTLKVGESYTKEPEFLPMELLNQIYRIIDSKGGDKGKFYTKAKSAFPIIRTQWEQSDKKPETFIRLVEGV